MAFRLYQFSDFHPQGDQSGASQGLKTNDFVYINIFYRRDQSGASLGLITNDIVYINIF